MNRANNATRYRLCHYPGTDLKEEWERFKADEETRKFYILGDPPVVMKEFKKMFSIIRAAGGLVENEKGEYLLIFRNKKWDLPKGKMDKGEVPRETAVREIEEECGIKKLKIVKPLRKTYHVYQFRGKDALKKTYWYAMTTKDTKTPVPQIEEGIEKAVWVKPAEFKEWKKETYPSVWNILKKVK